MKYGADPDKDVLVVLDWDFEEIYSRTDWPDGYLEELEHRFRSEPTVVKIQEMGFELREVFPGTGVFRTPAGWSMDRAIFQLPRIFGDILRIGPAGLAELAIWIDDTVIVNLYYEPFDPNVEVDLGKLEEEFRSEHTVAQLQEMGFQLEGVLPAYYAGAFKIAEGWTLERAIDELPGLFADVVLAQPVYGGSAGYQVKKSQKSVSITGGAGTG